MASQRKEGRKSFFAAFLLTLTLLSLIMVATVLAVQPALDRAQGTPFEPEATRYVPPAEDSLTLAVIGKPAQKGAAKQFLLIRFNPQHGQIPVTVLPAQALVLLEGERMTLAQAYATGGGLGVKQALAERLDIVVDRYAVIAEDAFTRIAAKAGTVLFTLPYDIRYTREDFPVNFTAGERRLDGQDILNLFAAPVLEQDPAEKSRLLSEICAETVNQNISAAHGDAGAALFRLAINLIDTDITSMDFELRRQSADFMSELGVQVSAGIPVNGIWIEPEKSFELSEESLAQLRKYYSPRTEE